MTQRSLHVPCAGRAHFSIPRQGVLAFAVLLAGIQFSAAHSALAADKILRVVTTTEDLAAIAREVAGDKATIVAIAHGYQDPHFVDAKPSYMVLLKRADVFVEVGRDLEIGWVPGLVNGARNPKILAGQPGHVDASSRVQVIEVPSSVSRAQGDIHPFGNPHYWLDPANGGPIAEAIRDALSRAAPAQASYFAQRTADFEKRLAASSARWKQQAQALEISGMKIVTYHRSWSYFARAYGLQVVDFIEPKPGIPPSPNHVRELEGLMQQGGIRLLLMEPYFDSKLAEKIARDTGVPLAIVPTSVGAEPGIKTYFDLFDRQFALLSQALKTSKP